MAAWLASTVQHQEDPGNIAVVAASHGGLGRSPQTTRQIARERHLARALFAVPRRRLGAASLLPERGTIHGGQNSGHFIVCGNI